MKNIPLNVNKRLSSISSNREVFEAAAPTYKEALDRAGYNHNLEKKNLTPEAKSLSDPCPQLSNVFSEELLIEDIHFDEVVVNPVSLDELMEVDVNIPVEMVQGEQVDDMQDLSESEDELDAITGDFLFR